MSQTNGTNYITSHGRKMPHSENGIGECCHELDLFEALSRNYRVLQATAGEAIGSPQDPYMMERTHDF
jgi:hypothetical protein